LAASSILGFAVVGTGALMTGEADAIRMGLLVWMTGTIGALVVMVFALRRSAWAAIVCALAAPLCLALLTGHFVLGVKTW
jgi:hypothetical protein